MTEQLSTAQHVMATASPVVNNLPAAQELQNPPSSILGQEDPLEKEMAVLLQDSCLENPMDRGAWQATVLGVPESQTQQKRLSLHACTCHGCSLVITY